MTYQFSAKTDIGCNRKNNEDAFGSSVCELGLVVIVADGMGGHHGGEIASEVAVNNFIEGLPQHLETDTSVEKAMRNTGSVAHGVIRQRALDEPELNKMGTTVVAAFLSGQQLSLLHAGDSRAYLCRAGQLSQLTQDHSVVQQMIDSGAITPAEAEHSPFKHLLSNSLGAALEEVEFSFQQCELQIGDKLLICTDGLTNALGDSAIELLLNNYSESVEQSVDQLIQQSLDNNAQDNVTVALIKLE